MVVGRIVAIVFVVVLVSMVVSMVISVVVSTFIVTLETSVGIILDSVVLGLLLSNIRDSSLFILYVAVIVAVLDENNSPAFDRWQDVVLCVLSF